MTVNTITLCDWNVIRFAQPLYHTQESLDEKFFITCIIDFQIKRQYHNSEKTNPRSLSYSLPDIGTDIFDDDELGDAMIVGTTTMILASILSVHLYHQNWEQFSFGFIVAGKNDNGCVHRPVFNLSYIKF